MDQPGGPSSHCLTSSGLVKASKTNVRGASKVRVITISRSPRVVSLRFPAFVMASLLSLRLRLPANLFFLFGFHVVEQRVESLEVAFPYSPVAVEPGFQLLQWRGAQGIDAALGVHTNVHESGFAEHAEMLGDLRLAETEFIDHVSDRARTGEQQFDDLQAV